MEFFAVKFGEIIEVGGLSARCSGSSSRSAFFEVLRLGDGVCFQEGWLDVTWCGDVSDGKVFLRFALLPEFATTRNVLQIKDDLYARLGILDKTLFQMHIVNFRHSREIHDERAGLFSSPVELEDESDPLDWHLFDDADK